MLLPPLGAVQDHSCRTSDHDAQSCVANICLELDWNVGNLSLHIYIYNISIYAKEERRERETRRIKKKQTKTRHRKVQKEMQSSTQHRKRQQHRQIHRNQRRNMKENKTQVSRDSLWVWVYDQAATLSTWKRKGGKARPWGVNSLRVGAARPSHKDTEKGDYELLADFWTPLKTFASNVIKTVKAQQVKLLSDNQKTAKNCCNAHTNPWSFSHPVAIEPAQQQPEDFFFLLLGSCRQRAPDPAQCHEKPGTSQAGYGIKARPSLKCTSNYESFAKFRRIKDPLQSRPESIG